MEPLLELTSHIAGKNAQVRLWPDRLEWSRKGRLSTGAKAGMAAMTLGMSYLATGVRGKQEGESIPIRSISHVQRGNSGFQDKVTIRSAAGDLEMRVSRAEADRLVGELNALINGTHPALQAPVHPAPVPMPAPVAPPVPSGPAQRLQELAQLHAQGILTDAEYAAAKAQALGL